MTEKPSSQKKHTSVPAVCMAGVLLTALAAGCTADPNEVLPSGTPIDCNDLRLMGFTIGTDDDIISGDETVAAEQPFFLQWFAEFRRGHDMSYLGDTGPFVALIEFEKNGQLEMTMEVDCAPIYVASGEHTSVWIEDGLPPGAYTVRVILDLNGTVDQCDSELEFVFNNMFERALTVTGRLDLDELGQIPQRQELPPLDELPPRLELPDREPLVPQE